MSAENTIPPGPRNSPRRLSGADRFWLRMDDPTNLMMVTGVMLFDERLDYERLRAVLRHRLLPIERFCERVVSPQWGAARWEPHRDLDLDEHLERLRLPEPADDAALRDLISGKMSQPLDSARPRWMFHLVENYANGSAVIGRFHHCMGDGMGMMMVLLAMTDLAPDTPHSAGAAAGSRGNPFLDLLHDTTVDIGALRRRIEEIMPEGIRLLLKPAEAFRSLGSWRRGAASASALARLTFRSPDSKMALSAPLGVPKRAAWSESIPLDTVAEVRDTLGGKTNDVLLTAAAGGIRRYLVDRHGEDGCREFRATVPVNLRSLETVSTLGNEFGLVYLLLPVEIADPVARLAELMRRVDKLKRSAEPLVSFQALSLMGRLPAAAQRALVLLYAAKATAVITSVPGPNRTLYFAGRPIRDLLFWVPRSAGISLGISILSYAGQVRLGVATDAGLVPDPENLVHEFEREFQLMRQMAGSV